MRFDPNKLAGVLVVLVEVMVEVFKSRREFQVE
jgi:hypothetical protein